MTPLDLALAITVAMLSTVMVVLVFALRRSRIQHRAAIAARAAAVAAQQRTAELAVAAERLRILREMHDVIAHSLAIMIAQADGGSYVSTDADAAQRAFTTIAETGRGALADTRRILGILKHSGDGAAELAPTPETGLDALAEQYRAAGLEVSLIRVGDSRVLPGGTRTALHRITQEALANALKHAGIGAQVIITENWRPEAVALTVTSTGGRHATATDPLTGAALPGLGMGLIGMRERAELLEGTLAAGPIDNGFQVRAELPFHLEEEQ